MSIMKNFGVFGPSIRFDSFFDDRFNRQIDIDKFIDNRYSEDDNSGLYTLVVPGFSKEDLSVEADNDKKTIIVSGSVKEENYENTVNNTIKVKDCFDLDSIEAEVKNGILKIKINKIKKVEKLPKKINIK